MSFKKIGAWIDAVMWGWTILLISLMTLSVIVSVFLRYVLALTFVWAEEVITMLFVSTTFFGAVLAVKDDEHIAISTVIDVMPQWLRRTVVVLGLLVVFGVQLTVLVTSIGWISQVGNTLTPGLRLPIRYFYLMIPVSSVLMLYYVLRKIARVLTGWSREDRESRARSPHETEGPSVGRSGL